MPAETVRADKSSAHALALLYFPAWKWDEQHPGREVWKDGSGLAQPMD